MEMEFFAAWELSAHTGRDSDFLEPPFHGLNCPCAQLCS